MINSEKLFTVYLVFFILFTPLNLRIAKDQTEAPMIYPVYNVTIDTSPLDDTKRHEKCLAENLYFEARGESYEGKLAVTQVVMNRVNSPKFPKDICDVIWQHRNGVHQFSWTKSGNTGIRDLQAWEECLEIARKALTETIVHDKLAKAKALFYHAVTVRPNWGFKKITKIGNHVFYASL